MINKIKEKLKSNAKQIQMICDYLIKECEHDSNLADRIMLENKTVDDMYKYILTAVKHKYKDQIVNQGVYVAPEDVYSMAIHYFIEDDETLKAEFPNEVSKAEVKANTTPAKEQKETVEKTVKLKREKVIVQQLSLFDLGDER